MHQTFLMLLDLHRRIKMKVQPVLIRCVNTNVKYEFMNAFKEKPIMCDEIGLGVKQHFFINHHHHQEI